MALEMRYPRSGETAQGDVYDAAYAKVTQIIIRPDVEAVITVSIYGSDAKAAAGNLPVAVEDYAVTGEEFTGLFAVAELDKSGVNSIKQAYEFVKGREEFSVATDV